MVKNTTKSKKAKKVSCSIVKKEISCLDNEYPNQIHSKNDIKKNIILGLDEEILESPFDSYNRPFPHESLLAVESLCKIHGVPDRKESVMPVLDALIRTILSQNTTDKISKVAFGTLKEKFPTWRKV